MPYQLISVCLVILMLSGCGDSADKRNDVPTRSEDTNSNNNDTSNKNSAPTFISDKGVNVFEHTVNAYSTQATDPDDDSISYSINGGNDQSLFRIDPNTGLVKFNETPDYENPHDKNKDNIYEITIQASDGKLSQSLQVLITVKNQEHYYDEDGDYIPDLIEKKVLGFDPRNSDQNENGVEDGLELDPFFEYQWHLRSTGRLVNDSNVMTVEGNDLNLLEIYHQYMGYNDGEPIIIQVVDDGIDIEHEDLRDNIDLSRSYNYEEQGAPLPPEPLEEHTHGTKVAGIIAARAFNNLGVRGVAPFSKIAGSNWLSNQTTLGLEKAWLTGDGANEIAISNNSWGRYFSSDSTTENIMKKGVEELRDGKGRVYIFSAGNSRQEYGNANLSYDINSRYPIVVAALKHDNTHSVYSSPGANLFVSAYAGNYASDSPTIGTTTITNTAQNSGDIQTKDTWSEDNDRNYTFAMNGTSAAAPNVSGSLALVLEACPNLTWRDIRKLTATQAIKVDLDNTSWIQNAAGLWHSIDYGFGLINPQGMINQCKKTENLLAEEVTASELIEPNQVIPDNQNQQVFNISMADNLNIEWVEITIDNDSSWASDYEIQLTSPAGTRISMMSYNLASKMYIPNWLDGGFRMGTPAMLNETSQGNWMVTITDAHNGDIGTLKSIKLNVHGTLIN